MNDTSLLPVDELQDSGDERRSAVRMPQMTGATKALLYVGKKRVSCEVLDESSGGFLITAKRFPKTSPSKPVVLITPSGPQTLRVVWQRPEADIMRMGLQRVAERDYYLEPPQQESGTVGWMMLAIVLGFIIGYFVAFRDSALRDSQAMRQFFQAAQGRIVNALVDEPNGVNPEANQAPTNTPDE